MSSTSHKTHRFRAQQSARQRGFALVLSLGLMALMVLLAVTLSALISVESEASRQTLNSTMARQNAYIALLTAVGQIQQTAGSDTRVSARSDILAGTSSTSNKWTGIWKSAGDVSASFTANAHWLVSAMNPDPSRTISTSSTLSVLMASAAQGLDSTTNSAVYAVKQPIFPASTTTSPNASNPAAVGNNGYFAYWVSDESLKAKFTIPNAMEVIATPTVSDKLTSMQVPRNYAFEFMDDAFANYRALDQNTLARISNPAQLKFMTSLSGLAVVPKSLLHDVTVDSLGILANARDGGLKLDLTTGFDNNGIYTSLFGPGTDNYRLVEPWRTENYNFTYRGRGPQMATMRDFARFYKRLDTNGRFAFELASAAGNDVSNEPTLSNATSSYTIGKEKGMDPQKNMVFPIISHVQISMGLRPYPTSSFSSAGERLYGLRSETRLLVGLYNPYNVPLVFTPSSAVQLRVDCDMLPYVQFEATYDDGTTTIASLNGVTHLGNVRNNDDYFQFVTTIDSPVLIPPGQIIPYSLSRTSTNGNAILQQGYSIDGYFHRTLTTSIFPYRTLDNTVRILSAGIVPPLSDNSFSGKKTRHGSIKLRTSDRSGSEPQAHMFSQIVDLWSNNATESTLPSFRGATTDAILLKDLYDASTGNFDPIPIGTWGYHLRTTLENQGVRTLIDSNIRYFRGTIGWDSGTSSDSPFYLSNPYAFYSGMGERGLINTQFDEFADMSSTGSLLWGNSTGGSGQSSVVLFHLPRRPPLSIGEFQNATLGSYTNEPSYVLGNSYANPRLPRTATASNGETNSVVFDISYLVNDGGIWDNYFLSGLSDAAGSSWINWKDNAALTAYYEDPIEHPLPNHRLVIEGHNGIAQPGLTELFPDNVDDYRDMASYLRLNGPFNVNSTSVPAWKAFLMSMRNLEIPKLNTSGVINGFREKDADKSAFVRTVATQGDDNDFWTGYRSITETEAQTLAENIVKGIKARAQSKSTPAPFQSMGEFVNRRLSSDDYGKSGVLQTAIDASNLNQPGGNSNKVSSIAGWNTDTQNEQAAAFPGMLMQGDLLQALSAVMTVRSDTFKVRAYGEHLSNDGQMAGQAWCEAVIQRTAEFVDDSLAPGATTASISGNPVNLEFGRRFKIVSFRWLSPSEL